MTATRRFLVPPPVWMLAAAGLQHLIAGRRTPTNTSVTASAALASAATILGVSAIAAFGRAGTTITPEHPERATVLVDRGVFAHTRNPMYLALAGALVAHAVLRRSWLALLPVAGFVVVIDRVQIPGEESALRAAFGRRYDSYRRSTRRWA